MARARDRIKAFLLDYLVIAGYLVALSIVGAAITLGPLGDAWTSALSTPDRMDAMAFVLSVLPVILYFAVGEASEHGGTFGKRRVGLRVVGPGGTRLTFARSLGRSCLKFLPWQMAHTAMLHIPGFPQAPGDPPLGSLVLLVAVWLLVGSYLAGLTATFGRRTPYDRLTGSTVVRAPDLG